MDFKIAYRHGYGLVLRVYPYIGIQRYYLDIMAVFYIGIQRKGYIYPSFLLGYNRFEIS